MGYYTFYSLDIYKEVDGELDLQLNSDPIIDSAIKNIEEESGYGECLFEQENKWYEHDDTMRTVSAKYPDLIFALSGSGEEDGDLWRNYYKNGKVQECPAKIEYDPYDENKLR